MATAAAVTLPRALSDLATYLVALGYRRSPKPDFEIIKGTGFTGTAFWLDTNDSANTFAMTPNSASRTMLESHTIAIRLMTRIKAHDQFDSLVDALGVENTIKRGLIVNRTLSSTTYPYLHQCTLVYQGTKRTITADKEFYAQILTYKINHQFHYDQ